MEECMNLSECPFKVTPSYRTICEEHVMHFKTPAAFWNAHQGHRDFDLLGIISAQMIPANKWEGRLKAVSSVRCNAVPRGCWNEGMSDAFTAISLLTDCGQLSVFREAEPLCVWPVQYGVICLNTEILNRSTPVVLYMRSDIGDMTISPHRKVERNTLHNALCCFLCYSILVDWTKLWVCL